MKASFVQYLLEVLSCCGNNVSRCLFKNVVDGDDRTEFA